MAAGPEYQAAVLIPERPVVMVGGNGIGGRLLFRKSNLIVNAVRF